MNLVMVLIPAVLYNTQLVKIGMLNVNAPKIGPSPPKPQPNPKKSLNLTVAVGKEGFILKSTSVDLYEVLGMAKPEGENETIKGPLLKKKNQDLENKEGKDISQLDYDYVALYNALVKLKDLYEDEKLLTLTGDPDTPFKYFIRVMDVVRYRLNKEYSPVENFDKLTKALLSDKFEKIEEEEDGVKVFRYRALWDQVTFAIAE